MRTILSPIVYKTVTAPCPDCGGKGFIKGGRHMGTCGRCGGTGKISVEFPDD